MGIDVTPPSKSPEGSTEADTPPPIKIFTNGAFKPRPPVPVTAPAYKECMKNHAASLGGHAVDGCGEFMPSPTGTVADPTSLKCAACGCHRNFHRREPSSPTTAITPPFLDFRRPGPPKRFSLSPSPPPPPPAPISYATHALFGLDHQAAPVTPTANPTGGRKRFRTKFSQEQKEQMHSISERLGWRMQKSDTAVVEEFCRQVGVSRGVLKVWMHNNKNTFGKKEANGGGSRSAENGGSNGGRSSETKTGKNNNNGSHFQNNPENNSDGVHFQISSNNSSNSSP